jgi:hypothetical protein
MRDERHEEEDDLVIQRAARVLGMPERFDDDFEQSLVEAIRADRPLRPTVRRRARPFSTAWWWSPLPVRVSPLAGLALAAGLVAIAVASTRVVGGSTPSPAVAQATHDTVTFVRFVFVGRATRVALVGDFNNWGGEATSLTPAANGIWTVSIPMTNGRHEYAFVVDGQQWMPDPLAPSSSDDFDTKSSIITVGI